MHLTTVLKVTFGLGCILVFITIVLLIHLIC